MSAGPEYTKIQTVFKRDARNLIVVGEYSLPEFKYLQEDLWRWTEKIDGTNMRLHWDGTGVTVGGRTDLAQIPDFVMEDLAPCLIPLPWLAACRGSTDVTVYGEMFGPKIQKGGVYGTERRFAVFDILVDGWWLEPDNVEDLARHLGLEFMPLMEVLTLPVAIDLVKDEKLGSRFPGAPLEGLVGRPLVDLYNRKGERVLVKVKVKDFRDLARRGGKS